MARPRKHRLIACEVNATYFKPQGIPMRELEEIALDMDEIEAIRLADIEGLYHADAALKMGVSRPTFGNIIKSAHKKVATALLGGMALRISEFSDCVQAAQDAIDWQANKPAQGDILMSEPSENDKQNPAAPEQGQGETHSCCGHGHGHSEGRECGCQGQGKKHHHGHGGGRCCAGRRGKGCCD